MRAVFQRFLRAVRSARRAVFRARVLTTFQTGTDPMGVEVPVLGSDVQMWQGLRAGLQPHVTPMPDADQMKRFKSDATSRPVPGQMAGESHAGKRRELGAGPPSCGRVRVHRVLAKATKDLLWIAAVLPIVALAGLALWIIGGVAWLVVSRPASSTAEMAAQGQLLVGAFGTLLTTVLVGTTVYYAIQTRRLVNEARATREEQRKASAVAENLAWERRLRAAAAALAGACSDVLATGSALAVLLRHRRVWRVSRAELAMQPVTAASRALDELRYLAPGASVMAAAEAIFDAVVDFFAAASAGAEQERLESIAGRMHDAKRELGEQVEQAVP